MYRSLAILVSAVFISLTGAMVPPEVQSATVLKVSTHSSGPGTPRADYLVRLSKAVKERTNGRVEIRIFWANSLVHAKEALEAVQIGTSDMADLALAYFPDKLKLLQVASLPFSVSDPVKQRDGVMRVLKAVPQVSEELAKFNHVIVAVTATASYQLPSHNPINDLAELKGKKVGTFGRIIPKVIKAAGAIPVSVSGGEMYEALQRGTIDARVLSYEASQRFKLYEVVKYISQVDLGALAGINTLTINKKKWDSLSAEDRNIILEEGAKVGAWEAQAMKDDDVKFKDFLRDQGVTIVDFSSDDREKWKNLPDVQSISNDWVASMDKLGLPGKKTLAIFLGK